MNRFFSTFLILSGMTGLSVYFIGLFVPKETLAESQDFTTAKVSATFVNVRQLPTLSAAEATQLRSQERVISTRIPGGVTRLNRIKMNPLSTPEGKLAAQANRGITPVSAPPNAKTASGTRATSTRNCVGNAATGFAPSDSHGAVGLNNYVEVTNVDLGIYPKTGSCSPNSFVSLKAFFGITDPNTTAFDPRAIYDFRNNRYVVTTETRKTSSTDQFQYFAVSQTGDPLGAWNVYRIPISEGSYRFCKKALTDFWDYPNLGYNSNQWFITANNFPTSGASYGVIMTIDKAPTLTGSVPVLRCYGTSSSTRAQVQFNVAPPLDRSTATTAYFLATDSGAGSQLRKYTLNTLTGAMTYNTPIAIPAWTAPPGAPQPTTTLLLDTLDGRIQSNTVQIGNRVYAIHALNVGGRSAIRLYRVNAGTNTAEVRFTYVLTGLAAWGPSFAIASTGSTTSGFFAFNYSGSAQNPAAALVASRNDGVGGFPGFTYQTGVPMTNSCQNGTRCRWGDYSATSLDPANLNSAFGVAQFMTGNSQFNWSTVIMGLRP